MKISFCVPIFNKEAFLADSIESILKQTHKDIEVILFDDKSSDGCQYICKHYSSEYPDKVKYYRNDFRMGVAFARNSAWSKATGDVICVNDADDLSMARRAELVNDYFEKNKDIDIVYGHALIIDSFNRQRGMVEAGEFEINKLKKENFIQHPTVAYRSSLDVRYREGLKYIDDWYFYLDCVVAQKKFGKINELLGCYRPLADGLTLAKGFNTRSKEDLKQSLRDEFSDLDDDLSEMLFDKKNIQYDRIKKIVKEIRPGSSVLDIGCNGGGLLKYLMDKKNCKVEGVESARNLVKICQDKGIKVYKEDARTYVNNNKYDYVLLTEILEHYNRKDMAHLLKNAQSMLKRDGKIIITIPYKHGVYNTKLIAEHISDFDVTDINFVLRDMKVISDYIYTESYSVPTWEYILCVN